MQSVILFFSPLLWSVVLDGIGQLAMGTGKLYKISPSCAWIFLFSTLWLWNSRVLKSLQQISPETEEFHTTCLQRPTHNLSTLLSLWVCVKTNQSSLPLPPCFCNIPMEYHWGLLELQAAPSLHLLSSRERVVLSPQCTGHCVPLHPCHDSSPSSVATASYLMHPGSTSTHPHLHTWQLCAHSCLSKKRINHYPRAPRSMKEDKGW